MPPAPETVEVDLIAPRHLAGGGDPPWITVPLHRACGWSHGNDPLIRTALSWQPAIWRADLDGNTPANLITAVTTALASDSPLIRAPGHMPHLARAQMTVRSHSVPAQSLASALEDRVR